MFRKNVSKIVSMGYTGTLPTNKIRKKTSIKKRFHKKMSQRPYQWGIQVSYKKLEEKISIKIISTNNYPKDCNNDSTKERY